MLRLKVLGGLSVHRDGRPLSGALAQPKRLAVLALLARGGKGGVSRDRVINTLWPDVDEERARHTFSQTLYALRRELGRDDVISGVRELKLDTTILAIDVVEFHDAIAARDLERAVKVYDGPFLDGFHLLGNDDFDRWADRERALLDRAYTDALEQLARDATARGDHTRAALWWRKRAARDPLNARIAISLMESLAASGDRVGAIQHARVHELLIAEELSLPADREVVRLAEELRREHSSAVEEAPTVLAPAADLPAIDRSASVMASVDTPAEEAAPAPVAVAIVNEPAVVMTGAPLDVSRVAESEATAPNEVVVRSIRPAGRGFRWRTVLVAATSLAAAALFGISVARTGRATPNVLSTAATPEVESSGRRGVGNVTTRSVAAYRMYERGLRAHYRGDVAAARSLFDAAVAEDSTFPMAQYYSAVVTGDQTELRRRLERARRLARHATDRERLTILAGWASAMAAPVQRAIAETLAIRYPTEVAGYLNLGTALISDGEYLDALQPLAQVVKLDASALRDPSAECAACAALGWTVRAYMLADSLDAAERVARDWLRLQPQSSAALKAYVDVLDVMGRGVEGDSVLRASGARVLETADAMYRRAGNLVRAGEHDAAQRLLADVIETGSASEQADAYWLLAIVLRDEGRLAEALDAARRVRVMSPRSARSVVGSAPSVAVLEAQLLLELGHPRAAAALFDSIARGREELDSDATAARRAAWNLTHSADARAAAGDTAGVRRLIDSVQALGARSGFGRDRRLHHHVRGLWLAARGDDEGAVAEFRRAIISVNFGYTRTNYELARALMRLGRGSEAVAVLEPALRGALEGSNLYVTRRELNALLAEARQMTSR